MVLAHTRQRRQDLSPSESPSPSTSPYSSTIYYNPNFDKTDFAPPTSSALDLSHYSFPTNDSYYIVSRQSTPSDHIGYGFGDTQYMQNSPSPYPQVRVQQSTPIPSSLPSADTPPPMIDENDFAQPSWSTYQDSSYLATNAQQQYNPASYRDHKRLSSGSSVGSGGPDSPYTGSSAYPQIVDPDNQSIHSAHFGDSFDGAFTQFPKPEFAPSTIPPAGDQSFYPAFQNFNLQPKNAVAMMSAPVTRPNLIQHRTSNGGGQNISRRSFGGESDQASAEMRNTPNLDRTISAAYEDELYNPAMASAPASQPRPSVNSQGHHFSPQNKAFTDLLQAANNRHSISPISNEIARQHSPFREGYRDSAAGFSHSNPSSPAPTRLGSAAQMSEQRNSVDVQAQADRRSSSRRHDLLKQPATISPKEVDLDYNESEADSKFTLFPPTQRESQAASANTYDRRFARVNTDENSNNEQSFGSMATSRRQSSSNYSESVTPQQSTSSFTFMPPSVPGMPQQLPQQYPFISNSRRQSSSMRSGSDLVPEFPASLTSMESTKSESGQTENIRLIPEASQLSQPSSQERNAQRPADTSANSGTYTCVASGCNLRFETSAKLQKHRREAHRTSPYSTSSPTTPSSTTTHNTQAAQNNVSRNNAPGPHRCEKMNPGTNKPCNTVFSRSYDLTRHEDTIHNNRKQKVRCHLCTEEKTFSRNDALTRHMRVVHPDVDFPGKQRRGRNSDGADVVKQGLEGRRGGR
jgi:26S proteasome regulatory subunit N4